MNEPTKGKSRRELLIEDHTSQVRRAVEEEITNSSWALSEDDSSQIIEEILTHTALVLDAVSVQELVSEGALFVHIANARCDAQRLIRDRKPPTRPGAAVATRQGRL